MVAACLYALAILKPHLIHWLVENLRFPQNSCRFPIPCKYIIPFMNVAHCFPSIRSRNGRIQCKRLSVLSAYFQNPGFIVPDLYLFRIRPGQLISLCSWPADRAERRRDKKPCVSVKPIIDTALQIRMYHQFQELADLLVLCLINIGLRVLPVRNVKPLFRLRLDVFWHLAFALTQAPCRILIRLPVFNHQAPPSTDLLSSPGASAPSAMQRQSS